jgi:hypothetical protein
VTDTQVSTPRPSPEDAGQLYVHFSTNATGLDVYSALCKAVNRSPLTLCRLVSSEGWGSSWRLLVTAELLASPSMTVKTATRATQLLLKNLRGYLRPSKIGETQVVWQLPLPLDLDPL